MAFPAEKTIPAVAAALRANRPAVLQAPPGSGKTTCVPPALLGERFLAGKKILMLEPRRLAARMAATYIAGRFGEPPGGVVGYSVRLERKVSPRTRLEILTEGLLARRFLDDPELGDAGLVIFDEFHERSLACDTAFAMALDVRAALRPDLRILVMSATLDGEAVARHLGPDAEIVTAEARAYPVETRFLETRPQTGTAELAASAAWRAAAELPEGDLLVFLPGEREISRTAEILRGFQSGGSFAAGARENPRGRWIVAPLYGALPREEQDAAVAPAPPGVRKIILATSIAETSLTIPGVRGVVDSGEMRVPRFSPESGMSRLATERVTRDRADQRRGRAGRTAPGVCWRLWTAAEDAALAPSAPPEILNADLAPLALQCAAWGVREPDGMPWMTPPPHAAWKQARDLLAALGATGADGAITRHGREMSAFPVHPRLSHAMISAAARGAGGRAAFIAALMEECAGGAQQRETDMRRLASAHGGAQRRAAELARRWARLLGRDSRTPGITDGGITALAFPDRLAKKRAPGLFTLSCGRNARMDPSDPLAQEDYLACAILSDAQGDAVVRLAAPIDAGEAKELFAPSIVESSIVRWDRRTDSVAAVFRRSIGHVVVEERPERNPPPEKISAAFMEGIAVKGVRNMPCWTPELRQLQARILFLRRTMPEGCWPDVSDEAMQKDAETFFGGFTAGLSRWRDLKDFDMKGVFRAAAALSGADWRTLDKFAPAKLEMPSGSCATVHYEEPEPFVAVRLQETFGLGKTPEIAGGRVPVLMKLLSPAMRPVQITKDLAGFWREGYALVRKEMRGRYPKHYWPEDPASAIPTRKVRPPGV